MGQGLAWVAQGSGAQEGTCIQTAVFAADAHEALGC